MLSLSLTRTNYLHHKQSVIILSMPVRSTVKRLRAAADSTPKANADGDGEAAGATKSPAARRRTEGKSGATPGGASLLVKCRECGLEKSAWPFCGANGTPHVAMASASTDDAHA